MINNSLFKRMKQRALKPVMLTICIISYSFIHQTKPTLFLIGDSTVRNGRGAGDGALWGWGNFISGFIDTNKVSVQNRALGGTSSRSFWAGGFWDKVKEQIKPGDIVIIQFGHNDGGPTTLKGISDDSTEVLSPYTKTLVMAHTYGWNIRKYIKETKAKGGIPVVASLIPRNLWKEGKVNRVAANFVLWAQQVAEQDQVGFINLNKIIADHYDELGEEKVRATFFNDKDPVHTLEAGARFNALCVMEGLQQLSENPLSGVMLKQNNQ